MNWRFGIALLALGLGTQCQRSPQANGVPPISSPTATPSPPVDLESYYPKDDPAVLASTPVDVTGFPKDKLLQYEGKLVTVRGKFALGGVVGPVITTGDVEIYFEPEGSYSWGREYSRIENRNITVTGILRFRHFKPSNGQHPPDYFYFRAETTPIKLK